jgi:S-layer homology domain
MMQWHLVRLWALPLAGVMALGGLTACNRADLERTFSADPKAKNWSGSDKNAQLPQDFPEELRYPNATLTAVSAIESAQASGANLQQTRWSTPDNRNQVIDFYRQLFQQKGWQDAQEATQNSDIVLTAKQQDLQASISILNGLAPQQVATGDMAQNQATQFAIAYQRAAPATGATPSPSPSPVTSTALVNTNQLPATLRPYVEEVLQLNVLTPDPAQAAGGNINDPNQPVSRATFARWLVEANNRLYRDRPSRQIRLANTASKPAFQDVPTNHPDFAAIQGLAESGYIPSALSGDSSQKTFRPGAPLTRETLLLWKVPVDRQQILPTVSSGKVKQLWGFRDSAQIAAPALSSLAADHQNGDLSNIRRMLGSTLLFQPQKAVTKAEAIASLWFIGIEGDSLSAKDLLRSEQQLNAQQQATPPESVTPAPSAPPTSPQ